MKKKEESSIVLCLYVILGLILTIYAFGVMGYAVGRTQAKELVDSIPDSGKELCECKGMRWTAGDSLGNVECATKDNYIIELCNGFYCGIPTHCEKDDTYDMKIINNKANWTYVNT